MSRRLLWSLLLIIAALALAIVIVPAWVSSHSGRSRRVDWKRRSR